MITRKLKERTFLIKGTPLPDRAKDSFTHRRGQTAVIMDEDPDLSEKYDTFFDYEDDLAGLKPSGEQYAEMISGDPYVILEEKDDGPLPLEEAVSEEYGSIMMEEESSIDNDTGTGTYRDVVGFEFVQCGFMKKDGNQCKRQAPSGREICSVHKKYVEKHGF